MNGISKLKNILTEFSIEHNVIIGVCDANPLFTQKKISDIPFSSYTYEQRTNPGLFLENARSIIVIGVGYGKKYCFTVDDKIRGIISQSAVGVDYHTTVTEKLNSLDEKIRKETGLKFDSKIHVDNKPLPERILAVKAGLGFTGKNGNIISKKFGSLFNIGCLVTTLTLCLENTEIENQYGKCGGCSSCIKECPGNAIGENGEFKYERCISYLTQKKGELTDDEKKKIGINIYGCDICQSVCPYNIKNHVEEITDINSVMPELKWFLSLDKKQFAEIYGKTAMYWRGQKTLKRNAEIALENAGK